MNSKKLFQSIKRFSAGIALSYLLLIGPAVAQPMVNHSQEEAVYIAQAEEATIEVTNGRIFPITNFVNWAS